MESATRLGAAPVMASNARPLKMGIAAASAALPMAPTNMTRMIQPLRRACEKTQRAGLRGLVVQGRVAANSLLAMGTLDEALQNTICSILFCH